MRSKRQELEFLQQIVEANKDYVTSDKKAEGQRIDEDWIDYIKRVATESYQGLEALAEAGASLNPSPIVEDVGIDCLATDYAKLDEVCSGFKELLRNKCIPKRARPHPNYPQVENLKMPLGGEINENNESCRPTDKRGKILPNLLQRSSGGGYYS